MINIIKKVVLISSIFIFVYIAHSTFAANFKIKKSINFPIGKESIENPQKVDRTFYVNQSLQAKDDFLGTYKEEESTWTNIMDGVVSTTGLSSGKIRKDERTGLWWSASSYSNSITNNLNVVEGDELRLTGGNAVAFCDGLNKANFGGKNDWYLPTQKELMQAYIDGIYSQNPEFGTTNNFWTSTEQNLYEVKLIWYVNVSNGITVDHAWSTPASVRCVRRDDFSVDKRLYFNQSLQAKDDYRGIYKEEESTWTNKSEGVIGNTGLLSRKIRKDERTGLWWSGRSSSVSITNHLNIVQEDGLRLAGGDAVAFCNGLNKANFGGKNDWYLPTQKELMQAYIDGIYSQDLYDQQSYNNGRANTFWASTVSSSDPKIPLCVDLGWGFVFPEDKFITEYSVRCVRRDSN